jgi:hypothetical protein
MIAAILTFSVKTPRLFPVLLIGAGSLRGNTLPGAGRTIRCRAARVPAAWPHPASAARAGPTKRTLAGRTTHGKAGTVVWTLVHGRCCGPCLGERVASSPVVVEPGLVLASRPPGCFAAGVGRWLFEKGGRLVRMSLLTRGGAGIVAALAAVAAAGVCPKASA